MTRVAVDVPVVIASSNRYLHSKVCLCHLQSLRGEFRKLGIPPCNLTFRGLWRFDIEQLWDDQHRPQANLLKHHIGSAPNAFHGHSAATCGHIAALLGLVSLKTHIHDCFGTGDCA